MSNRNSLVGRNNAAQAALSLPTGEARGGVSGEFEYCLPEMPILANRSNSLIPTLQYAMSIRHGAQYLLHAHQIFLGIDAGDRRCIYDLYPNSFTVPKYSQLFQGFDRL